MTGDRDTLTDEERARLRYSDGSRVSIRGEILESIVEQIVAARVRAAQAQVLETAIDGIEELAEHLNEHIKHRNEPPTSAIRNRLDSLREELVEQLHAGDEFQNPED